ncbi:MAG: pyruvate, phosphate dikinase [Actinomycetota bacterium]|nr:pyruvate, phosphate dikinase [Actinomycetota bacterium]
MVDLLGGKGANLAEMTRLGLPVPPGFVITTEACRTYLVDGKEPADLHELVLEQLRELVIEAGREFGAASDPLLVSVRSGARFSMPGMMETILNVGLTDATLPGLAARGGERFAWDCYRRLTQMYGRTVLGVGADFFEDALALAREAHGVGDDCDLDTATLKALTAQFRRILVEQAGEDLPQDPYEQLMRSIRSVFESWNGERARLYRAHERISDDLGTAVNIIEMVYGNTGPSSGSGVCFTRNPATGSPGAYGDYLPNAQGEDVVNGSRVTLSLEDLARLQPAVHAELLGHLETLERHFTDVCDVEFTVEDARLWILQTRVGKRSPAAAFRIAVDLVDIGDIGMDEALVRVDGVQLQSLLHPQFAPGGPRDVVATGLAASPGAAVGELVFSSGAAVIAAAKGRKVVLARPETSPDDLAGMLVAEAVITSRGGLTSHAAVVARGLGRACVTGLLDLEIDVHERHLVGPHDLVLTEGDVVSVDGSTGEVCRGRREVRPSPVAAALQATTVLEAPATQDPTAAAVVRLLAHADLRRHLGVRANAETLADARAAKAFGAEGIGLARTEHMLLGDRRELVENVVTDSGRTQALAKIEELTRHDFLEILEEMDGLPVVVRLLDPPLHEFLPDLVDLSTRVAVIEERGQKDAGLEHLLAVVRRWHEVNPMLGLRGVRLLAVVPELLDAQVRALAEALADLLARQRHPRLEIMVPLVSDEEELKQARARIEAALAEVSARRGVELSVPVGVMIELPRAALTSGDLATSAEFFSFGTNDLTQTTWGISRDDAETSFLGLYRQQGLLSFDPFDTLDERGVGRLMRISCEEGRAARPGLSIGLCGEHGGDPASVRFCADLGLDYVSCSPPRVPVARLEAGRAAVLADRVDAGSDTR